MVVPFGGGGLSSGIASAVKALRPETKVYAVEPETGAPLTAAFAAGEPTTIDFQASFVDGAGGPAVLPGMWPLVREVLDGAFAISLDETAEAVRVLARRGRVVAEGAASASAPAGSRAAPWSASSRAGTSTWRSSRRFSAAGCPSGARAGTCREVGRCAA